MGLFNDPTTFSGIGKLFLDATKQASAYGLRGDIHSGDISDFHFPWGSAAILRKVKRMVKTGKTQAPHEEIIENIAALAAIEKSHRLGRPVGLSEVWRRR